MAKENAKKFEELLTSDENLQTKLRAAADSYTGDKKDEKAVFDAVIVPLANEANLPFTYEEAREYAMENRELSLDEGNAAAGGNAELDGGKGGCAIIGITDEPETVSCINTDEGVAACAYVGVGFFVWW